jgi:hypothetical protein
VQAQRLLKLARTEASPALRALFLGRPHAAATLTAQI